VRFVMHNVTYRRNTRPFGLFGKRPHAASTSFFLKRQHTSETVRHAWRYLVWILHLSAQCVALRIFLEKDPHTALTSFFLLTPAHSGNRPTCLALSFVWIAICIAHQQN
jgi:hypothetical protein